MALVGDDFYVANTDALVRFPYHDRRDADHARRASKVADLPAGTDQPPLDQEHHREPRRLEALRDGRLEQQRRRERHGGRGRTARRSGSRPRDAAAARVRLGPAQPERHGVGAADRRAVDRGQRARRARQRPRARLPDLGAGRRVLRLAVQLLRPARRRRASSRSGPDLVAKAIAPDYALGAHTASLGLAFYDRRSVAAPRSRTACSSASTARGTASRAAATR